MASCKNRKLIGPYLDGQLGECRWLDEHISECSECLREYEALQRIAHLATKADFAPPESSYWRGFARRIEARIAVSERPKLYARILANGLYSRLTLGVGIPLMAVAVVLMALGLAGLLIPKGPVNVPVTSEMPMTSGLVTGPDMAPTEAHSPATTRELEPSTGPIVVTSPKSSLDEQPETESLELPPIKNYSTEDVRSSTVRYPAGVGPGPVDIALAELNGVRNYAIFPHGPFDTDQVIRYQMLAGSNSSLVPLSAYREALGRYFAPDVSLSRDIFDAQASSNWGFARGDDRIDAQRLRHLRLELELSIEK